jgi:hypothetical protein
VNENLVERLRVWVLEIRRGNGPLDAPIFAVERDEKLIEESKCYGNHVEPYAHNDEENVEGESEEESEDIYVAGTIEPEARNDAPDNHPKVGGKTIWVSTLPLRLPTRSVAWLVGSAMLLMISALRLPRTKQRSFHTPKRGLRFPRRFRHVESPSTML